MKVCDMPLKFLLSQEEVCEPPINGGQLKPIEDWPIEHLGRLGMLLCEELRRRLDNNEVCI